MTATIETQLRTRSEAWLRQRMDMNRSARFGLEEATPEQLNIVYILCKRWGLDPVTDLTLYQGHPWITVEGHLRKMREHPDYRGFSQRPLTPDEKLAWGYEPDDIVVETTIKTERWGEITQWGKVARTEIDDARQRAAANSRRPAPIGTSPVEIAQKRSVARAHRAAFGMDAPDEQEIEREVAEEMAAREDPVRVQANARRYDEVFASQDPYRQAEPLALPAETPEAPSGADVIPTPATGAETAPRAAPDFSPWERNRALMTEAYALGLRLRDLPAEATDDDVVARNVEVQKAIAKKQAG